VQTGEHDDWLDAVLASPVPLLPPALLEKAKEATLERQHAFRNPELAQKIRAGKRLRDLHATILKQARLEWREYLPADDPIARQAQGSL
jgi:hypothetical protein